MDLTSACGRLRRQTSTRTKTSARLKITFVDMTYPGQRPEPPSLSPHFLLQDNQFLASSLRHGLANETGEDARRLGLGV